MKAELRYSDEWLQMWMGDCRDALAQMPEKSVHTCITSPPFYGLRDYGTALWEGGDDPECDHRQMSGGRGTNVPQTKNPGVDYPVAPHRGGDPNHCGRCGATRIEPTIWGGDREHEHVFDQPVALRRGAGGERDYGSSDGGVGRGPAVSLPGSSFCECGAWRGALGLEPTPEAYVAHLVEVFDEVWRVLRDDGILWLNLGDSFANDTKWGGTTGGKHAAALHGDPAIGRSRRATGLKSKDLIGIPWMAAFALRTAGWYLRGDIVWNKPNAMPESVDDRPTRSHEFIFMLTKNPQYYFDTEAVKEPVGEGMIQAAKRKAEAPGKVYQHDEATRMGKTSPNRVWSDPEAVARILAGRHIRDVWTIPTVSYAGAHFATWPPKLVEPMIKAATSEHGCCSTCGAGWERKVRVIPRSDEPEISDERKWADGYGATASVHKSSIPGGQSLVGADTETIGWQASCGHEGAPVPSTVLDVFGGSGTTAMVAQSLGRKAVLIDLNPEYSELQMTRNRDIPLGL